VDAIENAVATPKYKIEPISKSFEKDNEAGELDKAEEIVGVVLPANEAEVAALLSGHADKLNEGRHSDWCATGTCPSTRELWAKVGDGMKG
jgi:hypothetical protein